ncbi:MAG: HNH endonuclease, partial [Bacteroidales bacterium]|nr:HNH endonuclease [Bacteroidales bacterium]
MGQKSINEELKKGDIFKLNGMKPEQLAKMIASKSGVTPTDFTKGKSDTIVYSPKRTAKPKQQTISKPEDMSVEEYKEKYVIPMNPELKDEEGEEWRPVPNKGRYFGGDAQFDKYYEVSNYGRLRMINLGNAAKSSLITVYDAPTRKGMQVTLNAGDGLRSTPNVKYMVADAFLGEHDTEDNMVIHIDGDYHNNRADNLKWVPRKKQTQQTPEEISEAFVKAFNKGKGRHDLQELISKGVKRIVTESFADKYENTIDTIEYYMGLTDETGMPLSQEQHEQLEEIVDFLKETDTADNPNTEYWISEAEKLLNNQGQMNISDYIINETVKKALHQLKEKSGIEIIPEN